MNSVLDRIKIHECDLCDLGSVISVLSDVQPTHIFHLASHANVRAGFITPISVIQNNVIGTLNLFEAIRLPSWIQKYNYDTSEVYGQVDPENVQFRNLPTKTIQPICRFKDCTRPPWIYVLQVVWAKIITTRMFAYFNPRRPDLFSTSFARQVARIEAGLQDTLWHGNLDSVRTMIDVRTQWKLIE